MKKTDERELRVRFGEQYGVVSRGELRRLGVDRQLERARVARGDWERVGRRVVRLRGTPVSEEQALMAACLEAGPSAVASHQSAAWLWGLLPAPRHHSVTVARSVTVRDAGFEVHKPVDYPRVVFWRAVPCTDPLRTLVDLAGVASSRVLDEALDSALAKRLVGFDGIEAELRRSSRQGRKGVGALRASLDRRGVSGAPAPSVLESAVLRLLRSAALEPLGTEVCMGPDGRYRVDVQLNEKLVLEFDGYTYHHSPEQKAEDERRRNRLKLAGITVLVYTWVDVRRDGRRVLREVSRARASQRC